MLVAGAAACRIDGTASQGVHVARSMRLPVLAGGGWAGEGKAVKGVCGLHTVAPVVHRMAAHPRTP